MAAIAMVGVNQTIYEEEGEGEREWGRSLIYLDSRWKVFWDLRVENVNHSSSFFHPYLIMISTVEWKVTENI